MDEIIAFITPVNLTKRYPFSAKVFVNWITLYTVIGLVISIILALNPSGVQRDTVTIMVNCTFGTPAFMCACGLIGLAIDSIRGEEKVHDGWYWLLYPFISYVIIAFGVFFIFLAIILFFVSLSTGNSFEMPKFKVGSSNGKRTINPNQSSEDFLKKHLDDLEEYQRQEKERIEQEQSDNYERGKYFIRERIIAKIRQNPKALLGNILTDEEMDELITMLLEILA